MTEQTAILDKGQLWRVETGDCRDVLKTLPDACVDAVVTDPPYNVGYHYDKYNDAMPEGEYLDWQLSILADCERLVKPGGSVFYLHYPEFAARIFWAATKCRLHPFELISWNYHAHTGGQVFRKAFRLWCWWVKGSESPTIADDSARRGIYRNPEDTRVQSKIERGIDGPIDYDWWLMEQVKNVSTDKTAHPCQLPAEMVGRIVRLVTPLSGVVLDPFSGSGTTGVAAISCGRRFVGCELSPTYSRMAKNRIGGAKLPLDFGDAQEQQQSAGGESRL